MSKKIVHLTSAHAPTDTRIFHKECKSLVKAGYEVVFIVPHSQHEFSEGVQLRAVPKPKGLGQRVTHTLWQIFRAALREKAQIYHFHDPDLLLVGLLLRLFGKKVVYDVHENYLTSIRQRDYLPKPLQPLLVFMFDKLERLASRGFEVVLAERYYTRRFPQGVTVLNYPLPQRIEASVAPPPSHPRLLYTGTVTEDRGALQHSRLLAYLPNSELHVVGRCSADLAQRMVIAAEAAHNQLHLEGIDQTVPYNHILEYYRQPWTAGLALFPHTPHYLEKELTKFFEYMAAGIPIICSNFPTWQTLMSETGAGFCVDPTNMAEAVNIIQHLVQSPTEVRKIGEKGRRAVQTRYNWSNEAQKLLNLYARII